MGATRSKAAAASAARRTAAARLVADQYLPGRVMVTCRIYDEITRQYRTMPVSAITLVRDVAEFERLWGLLLKVVESDAWTHLTKPSRPGQS